MTLPFDGQGDSTWPGAGLDGAETRDGCGWHRLWANRVLGIGTTYHLDKKKKSWSCTWRQRTKGDQEPLRLEPTSDTKAGAEGVRRGHEYGISGGVQAVLIRDAPGSCVNPVPGLLRPALSLAPPLLVPVRPACPGCQ